MITCITSLTWFPTKWPSFTPSTPSRGALITLWLMVAFHSFWLPVRLLSCLWVCSVVLDLLLCFKCSNSHTVIPCSLKLQPETRRSRVARSTYKTHCPLTCQPSILSRNASQSNSHRAPVMA